MRQKCTKNPQFSQNEDVPDSTDFFDMKVFIYFIDQSDYNAI